MTNKNNSISSVQHARNKQGGLSSRVWYKVVKKVGIFDTRYYSYNASVGTPLVSIPYNVHEWTYPELKGSKLFIFDSIKNAFKMKGFNSHNYRIFECEAINPKPVPYEKFYTETFQIKQWWNIKFKKKKPPGIELVPVGSYWCDAIKLTNEIYNPYKRIADDNCVPQTAN